MDDLLNTAPCGFLCCSDDGIISQVNETLCRWLGYEPGEPEGRHIDSLLSIGGRIFHQTHIRPLLMMSGKADEIYFSLKAKAGKNIEVLTNAVRREQEGRFINHYVFLPMSQRREYEDELLRAKKIAEEAGQAKAQFLTAMSHELRTPMNAILGFGQLLRMEGLNATQEESVGHILKSGQHLLDLINEVLDISRVEAGQMEVALAPVPAHDAISEAFDIVQPLARKAGIETELLDGAGDGRFVLADRGRLRQILLNLLANGIKYNRPGGRVTITCVPETKETDDLDASKMENSERLRFSVCDTGIGIAADKLNALFQPFERLGAESTQIEGTGLGLALSKRLTEAMGGEIGVESTLGEGSCFWVEFPIVQVEKPVSEAGISGVSKCRSEASSSTSLVLYIDDSLSNQKLMKRILARRSGVLFLSASHGELGLEMARDHSPSLILLDVQLPDIHGDAVLDLLQKDKRTRHIPVVMLSADATAGQIKHSMEAGASHYLTKPFEVPYLLEIVDGLLDKSEPD